MFFPKLRRRAKWVFLGLAVAFAGSFVFFGVGAGGSGIGDYLSDLFNRQPTTGGPSVEAARERVEENPRNADAQLDLANALQSEGRTQEAIVALQRYVELRPRDADALQQLASLYGAQAARARDRVTQAQLASQEALFAQDVQSDSALVQELSQGPVMQAIQEQTSERTNAALQEMQRAYKQQASVYQRLTLLLPDDPRVFFELGLASEFAGDTASAIAAYERFLELAPDDPRAQAVRDRVKELESFGGATAGGG